MRAKRNGYGVRESYARYGLEKNRAKILLKECRAGEHAGLLQAAARQAEPDIAEWIILSIMEGKSLHDMEIRWELGEAEIMPCSRNSFYAYRKLTLAILDHMLAGEGAMQDGRL
ncbi:hypothetical protein AALC25_20275 [Lachnospiraceae bacterium 29-84]